MRNIIHQTQPTSNSCVSATTAMILGEPVEEIIKELHIPYMADMYMLPEYLESKGLEIEVCSTYTRIDWGFVYTLSVPSLNIKANNHSIIFDCREVGNAKLFDPNKGKEGKLYYIAPSNSQEKIEPKENEYELASFVPDIKFLEI